MIGGFTLKKSGSPAIRQSGRPAVCQGVVLNFFFVIITFFIVAMIPSFHTLKAQVILCTTECNEEQKAECERHMGAIEGRKSDCGSLLYFINNLKAAHEEVEDLSRSSPMHVCDRPGTDSGTCRQNIKAEYRNAENALQQEKNRITQRQERDQERCLRAKRELRGIRAKLPPECRGTSSTCQTDAEKCRSLLGQLGSGEGFGGSSGGPLGLTSLFQNRLASECPQAAAAKFDDDKDRLRELVTDHGDAQDEVERLQGDVLKETSDVQTEHSEIEKEIQDITRDIKNAPTGFERATDQLQEQLSGQVAELRGETLQINRQIRARITELESIQNNDNEAADRALVIYSAQVARIFTKCDEEAKDRMAALRGQLNNQVQSGTVQRVADATRESRLENLRQTAVKAYARCRSSQVTQDEVRVALQEYELQQRAIARKEQELIDEITSLREAIESIHEESEGINESGQRAYKIAQQQYVSLLEDFTNKLHRKNLEKQRLDANFVATHQQLQTQLFNERVRATQLNGEMVALEQVVEVSRPTSIFGNLNYDEYDSLNEYDGEFENTKEVCCPSGTTGEGICRSGTTARSYLRRSTGGRGN